MNIKKKLSGYYYGHIYDTALGCRLRKVVERAPIAELRPFNTKSAISDLFVWRCDQEWETEFDLFNITSFVYPTELPKETCKVIIFNDEGGCIATHEFVLEPFEKRSLKLSELIGDAKGLGTFAIFHHSTAVERYESFKSHLTERGYIAYSRRGDVIRSFCHGNLQALSQAPNQKGFSYVAATAAPMRYHPQLILSDSRKIELIYTNPSPRSRDLLVNFFDKESRKIEERKIKVPARSVKLITVNNPDGKIHTFDNVGSIVMWRPVIKKYYETHFDVMHG